MSNTTASYNLLAEDLEQHILLRLPKSIKPSPRRASRARRFFANVKRAKISLAQLAEGLLKPTPFRLPALDLNESNLAKKFVGPIVKQMRRKHTLDECAKTLGLKSSVAFHYWEKGLRDMPLPIFLEFVDKFSDRLAVFCLSLGFKQDLKKYGLKSRTPDFYEKFFSTPWLPTLFLLIQIENYQKLSKHDDYYLAEKINLPVAQIRQGLKLLQSIGAIYFVGQHYQAHKGVFYTPPNIAPEHLAGLNNYWLGQSVALIKRPGLHKIEQASMSYESMEKIKGWVAELREKIRTEIKTTTPETVVHMHWQVADLS